MQVKHLCKCLEDHTNERILQPEHRLNTSENISMITAMNTFCNQNVG